MADIQFDYEELLAVAVFEEKNRKDTVRDLQECLEYMKEDKELTGIVKRTVRKLKQMSDEDFLKLDLKPYKQQE